MPFVGSVEGKVAFGKATATNNTLTTTNMLLYLDAGNLASYPGTGTTWTDLSPNANNATGLIDISYNSSNGGYLLFNGTTSSGSLLASKYNSTYTGKTVFVAGNLTAITATTYRAFLGSTGANRNFNFYMYSPSASTYQLHFSSNNTGLLTGNITYTSGNWFTAAFTQTTDGTSIFYFNGQPIYTSNMTFSQYLSSAPEWVGRADNYWNGPLPIICVYKTALTATQILGNHNSVRGRYGLA